MGMCPCLLYYLYYYESKQYFNVQLIENIYSKEEVQGLPKIKFIYVLKKSDRKFPYLLFKTTKFKCFGCTWKQPYNIYNTVESYYNERNM